MIERDRRRVLGVRVSAEHGIEVRQRFADVLVEMGDAVHGLETGITCGILVELLLPEGQGRGSSCSRRGLIRL